MPNLGASDTSLLITIRHWPWIFVVEPICGSDATKRYHGIPRVTITNAQKSHK